MAEHTGAGRIPFVWLLAVATCAAVYVLGSLWSPVLLAAWCAHLARPLHRTLSLRLGGRSRSAATLTLASVIILLVPLLVMGLSALRSGTELVNRLHESRSWDDAVGGFLSDSHSVTFRDLDPRTIVLLAQRHGENALGVASSVLGAATKLAIFLVVFLACFYTFLVERRRIHRWLLAYLPLRAEHTDRLGAALFETGNGLLISFGLTALLQASMLTLGYLIIGVPSALVLGLLTFVVSFVPLLGTGLVWVPVTLGLLLSGQTDAGLWSLGLGCVVSLLDNILRSAFSRMAELQMPTLLSLVAMLGGAAALGPGGLLLGPLVVRLALESLAIWREDHTPATVIVTPPIPRSVAAIEPRANGAQVATLG